MLIYLDDILIFSDMIEECAQRVKMVFERIRETNFQLNLGKYTFTAHEVAYLGHVMSASGMSPDE
jgi:hypothetical protein